MPIPAPIIAAIIGAATSAVTGGLQLSGAFTPGKPKTPDPTKATPGQIMGEKAAIGNQLPGLQAQVGGSVSPEYFQQMATLLSGTAGRPGVGTAGSAAINEFLSPGQPGVANPPTYGGLTSSPITSAGTSSNNIVASGIDELFDHFGSGGRVGLTG